MLSKKKGGFTLIEALVAIMVLVVGVLGPLSIAARGIADGFFARDQVTANFLAQEGMELVINRRETNRLLNPGEWLSGLGGCVGVECGVELVGVSFFPCSGGDSCKLVYDTSGGRYLLPDGLNDRGTVFTRKISLADPVSIDGDDTPDEVKVSVTVEWKSGLTERRFGLISYLYRRPTT